MTDDRPTLDIARDLRRMSVDDDSIALVVEAADRLEFLHGDVRQAYVSIAIREGERDRVIRERDSLARRCAVRFEENDRLIRERDTAREVARSNKAVTEGYAAELDRLRAGVGEQSMRTTCGYAYVGIVGEFTCDKRPGHDGNHWESLAEFAWSDEVTA